LAVYNDESYLWSFVCVVADLPTDIEMSKVVADVEYAVVGSRCLADDVDANADDNAAASNAIMKVELLYVITSFVSWKCR